MPQKKKNAFLGDLYLMTRVGVNVTVDLGKCNWEQAKKVVETLKLLQKPFKDFYLHYQQENSWSAVFVEYRGSKWEHQSGGKVVNSDFE